MATTSPDNIWTPDAGDDYALTADLATFADTVQDAITNVRTSVNRRFYGTAANRATVTGMVLGDEYQETDGSQVRWEYNGSAWVIYGRLFSATVSGVSHTSSTTVFVYWGSGGAAYTELFDPREVRSPSTNPTRIVVPEAGQYRVTTNMSWGTNTSGNRVVTLYKNGVSVPGAGHQFTAADNSGGNYSESIILDLSSSDYLEVLTRQSSGGTLTLNSGRVDLERLR